MTISFKLYRYCAASFKRRRVFFMKMKTMPTNTKTTQRLKLIQAPAPPGDNRENKTLKQKQPHVSLPRWHQLVLLFSQLPPCCHDLHGKGSVQ